MKLTGSDIRRIPHLQSMGFDTNRLIATGVSTDSRTVAKGDCFVALRGGQFDGHDFVTRAVSAGAVAVIVDRRWAESNGTLLVSVHVPRLVVEETTTALGQLANLYRREFDIPVIAVGGSNGKTTTKEMIRSVLAQKFKTLATEGNLNNAIGVPRTLFRLEKSHEVAVVEAGTNHPGEITALCGVLEPTHGLITNIGREHLEFFGSVDGVANAEAELFRYLGSTSGTAFVNADDAALVKRARSLKKRIPFGMKSRLAAIKGKVRSVNEQGCATLEIRQRGKKPFSIALGVPGLHNAQNALAAAAIGLTLRVPVAGIQKALAGFAAASKRMQVETIAGVTVLNDTYNANPDSVMAALATLAALRTPGRKIAVLADMLELGPGSEAMHRAVGQAVKKHRVDTLLTFGPLSKHTHDGASITQKQHYDVKQLLSEQVLELLSAGDAILIKGSRGMKMEDVVAFIADRLPSKGQK
jgi:UDP-N-acetylmuramoyl-tripeptide--D-alanyl-D-alanine ligase